MSKKIANFSLIILFFLKLLVANHLLAANNLENRDQQPKLKKIVISQVAEHPAFTATNNGIIDGLASYGYSIGYNLTLQRQAIKSNPSWGAKIAKNFVKQRPDLIIAIGTMSAENFILHTENNSIKLLFSSVTNPLGVNLNQPNISGISSFINREIYLQYLKSIQPNLKNLGILYNRLEKNSALTTHQLEQGCQKFGINLIKYPSYKANNLELLRVNLAFKSDAILIIDDNNAAANFKFIMQAADTAQIPVYVGDIDAIKLGALAALGPNQYDIGFQTGEMAAKVLDGEDINSMPIKYINDYKLYINLTIAKKLGIEIPQHVIKDAIIISNL